MLKLMFVTLLASGGLHNSMGTHHAITVEQAIEQDQVQALVNSAQLQCY